jgi:hypothetical protein
LSSLGTAHVLAAPAPAMRPAAPRAASNSGLGATLDVLAASASAMRDTVQGAAFSSIIAARVLAPLAATMRDAVWRVALS